jgi:hypothetical protein
MENVISSNISTIGLVKTSYFSYIQHHSSAKILGSQQKYEMYQTFTIDKLDTVYIRTKFNYTLKIK